MSDFQVLPTGNYISGETHERICKELHAQIRQLIVENEKLRHARTLTTEKIEELWSGCHYSGRAPIKFAREIERLVKGEA